MKKLLKKRLIELRERRGISRQNLARLAKMSHRQLVRIEHDPDSERRSKTVENLANALDVDADVLTGDRPMPVAAVGDASSMPANRAERDAAINVKISPDVRLAYDLIRYFYGINQSDLVRAAPLLLALLAEGSVEWRREKTGTVRGLLNRLKDETGWLEATDIRKRCDQIAENLPPTDTQGRDLSTEAAFVAYLRALAGEVGNVCAESIKFHKNDFLDYRIFRDTPDWRLLSPELKSKIAKGEVRFPLALLQNQNNFFPMIERIDKIGLNLAPLLSACLAIEFPVAEAIKLHEGLSSGTPNPELSEILNRERIFLKSAKHRETFQIKEWCEARFPEFSKTDAMGQLKMLLYYDASLWQDAANASAESLPTQHDSFRYIKPIVGDPAVQDALKALIDDAKGLAKGLIGRIENGDPAARDTAIALINDFHHLMELSWNSSDINQEYVAASKIESL